MTERRDRDQAGGKPARAANRKTDPGVLELGSQAGNKAMAELLGTRPAAAPPASAGLRVLDSMRAGPQPAQREFALVAQRDLKQELKALGRLLRAGSQGEDVRELQGLLGVTVDGIFGDQTRAAVIGFQKANGLAVDGIVGPITWGALVAQGDRVRAKQEEQKLDQSGSAAKIPAESTDKIAPETTDKIPPETTEKIPSSTEKIPSSTEKIPSSTEKIPSSTDKLEPSA
jgi:peptidoglycan hydrolase-like protein with peptidoglycan-binding domain